MSFAQISFRGVGYVWFAWLMLALRYCRVNMATCLNEGSKEAAYFIW